MMPWTRLDVATHGTGPSMALAGGRPERLLRSTGPQILNVVVPKGTVISASIVRVSSSRERKGEKLENFLAPSRKNAHLKVQMGPHVMSACAHIL